MAQPGTIGVFSQGEVLGDALYKLVFLRGLRAAFPAARITWLTVEATAYAGPLAPVAGPPLLDAVAERCGLDQTPRGLFRAPPRGLGPFDLLLDTQSLLLRTLVLRRVPHGRFLSAALMRRGRGGGAIGPHALDRLFALVEVAAGRAVPRDLSPVALPPALREAAEAALPGWDGTRIALAPGAGRPDKAWPVERYVALAQGQAARGRTPVFLLGPQEAAWRARIAEAVPNALFPEEHPAFAALLPAAGPKPLRAVAVAARCAAGVANDAGGGHMIAAAGIPLLSLFGPTRPEKFRPVAARWALLRAQDFGGAEMARIPLPAVEAALEGLLPLDPPARPG